MANTVSSAHPLSFDAALDFLLKNDEPTSQYWFPTSPVKGAELEDLVERKVGSCQLPVASCKQIFRLHACRSKIQGSAQRLAFTEIAAKTHLD